MSGLKNILLDDNIQEIDDLSLGLEVLAINNDFLSISETTNSLKELATIAVNLEKLIDLSENKNITVNEYQYFKAYSDYLLKDFNLPNITPSIESFNEDILSLEAVKDVAKKAWKTIKVVAKKTMEKIKGWSDKIFKTNLILEAKCRELLTKAKEYKNENKEAKEGEISFNLSSLLANGQSLKDLGNNLSNLEDELTAFVLEGKVGKSVKIFWQSLEGLIKNWTNVDDPMDMLTGLTRIADDCIRDINTIPMTSGSGGIPQSVDDPEYKITKHGCLIGNNALYSMYPKSGIKVGKNPRGDLDTHGLTKFYYAGVTLHDYSDKELSGKLTVAILPPDLDFLVYVLETSQNILTIIKNYKHLHADVEKIKQKILWQYEEVVEVVIEEDIYEAAVAAGETAKGKMVMRQFAGVPQRLAELIDHPRFDLINLGIGGVAKVVSYCQKALRAYSD